MLGIILIVLLVMFLLGGGLAVHPWNGPAPMGIGTVLLIIVIVLLIAGRL